MDVSKEKIKQSPFTLTTVSPVGDPMYNIMRKGNVKAGLQQYFDPGGLISNTFGRKKKDKAADDYARWLLYQQIVKQQELRAAAIKRYKSGTLTEGEQAQVGEFKGKQGQALERQLASMGISDSSVALDERGRIDLAAAGMEDAMLDADLKKSLQALGMGGDAQAVIRKMNTDDRQQAIQVYQGFMSILGGMSAYGTQSGSTQNVAQGATATEPEGSTTGGTMGSDMWTEA